jgi:predicted NUDIX family phosphoesterase
MGDERILGFRASLLDRLGRFQGFSAEIERYFPAILRELEVRDRGPAEQDPSFKQLIPYVVFVSSGQVFRYVRGKRGSEARLHELHSVGVGGHIAAGDVSLFEDSYQAGLRRELQEEVELPPGEERQRVVGLINDDSTPVGQVHFGVVHLWELPEPRLNRREGKLLRAGFAPLEQLVGEREKFETWSQFVLDWLAARRSRA